VPNLYGLLITLSIISCLLVVRSFVKDKDSDVFWGVAFWPILCGITGARLYHVLSNIPYYSTNLLKVFEISKGGLGIWGAIFGGALGAYVYLKIKKQNVLSWFDLIAISLPLGQAIGRWGNFFNQEIFGLPTNLPWGIPIKPENRPPAYLNYEKFHPLFLYESVLDFVLFIVLLSLYKRRKGSFKEGTFLALYLGFYSAIRFFLEYLRINPWEVAGLNVSQCVSILVLGLSVLFLSLKGKNDIHFF
jgi:phosphatidylglycerol:prolipoprotein diacylglycerol transferase